MDVNDKRTRTLAVKFSELSIGDVYECEGLTSIKTSNGDIGNCIYFDGKKWEEGTELPYAEIIPLKSILEIEG